MSKEQQEDNLLLFNSFASTTPVVKPAWIMVEAYYGNASPILTLITSLNPSLTAEELGKPLRDVILSLRDGDFPLEDIKFEISIR